MPTAEVNSYELAFHVLPTVVEGEVPAVFQKLKDIITNNGGETTIEEAPERFELAYEIERYLEGRYRKFSSAYFGWVRFTAEPAAIAAIETEVKATKELLRHLIIKLDKAEEAHPFYFHEALAADKKSETIDVDEETATVEPATDEEETESENDTDEETESSDKV